MFRKRKSIRKFDPSKIVPDEVIKDLLEAAMLAPSACNARSWEFIVIKNDTVLNEITKIHDYAQMIKTSRCCIVVVGLLDNCNGKPGENMWPQDCAAATENILLQATDFGLGSCWCGIYPTKLVPKFQQLLQLSANKVPFNVIAIGYPAVDFGSRGFYDENIVTWVR
ncbi:MAG: nitroreductase family protein [Christensenellaceae bacterium]|nr:nitroreductase family protein [Christensenellaceae bacterium]